MSKKKILYGIYITLLLLVGSIYFFYHPAHYQMFPKCIFKNATGLSCPGCGAQRAMHELLHFNLKNAFAYNGLLVLSLPYVLVGILFHQTSLKKKFPKARQFLFGSKTLYVILGTAIGFFIFRNI